MKDNLELKKFEKEYVNGTYNLIEQKVFFNSKIMDIEDEIIIDNKSIQYYQIIDNNDDFGFGYQYYTKISKEKFEFLDVIVLKKSNHSITLLQQDDVDKMYNTKWSININSRNILREYLFAKVKEYRTFKTLKSSDFLNKNINASIYDYINNNILDRYMVSKTNLYIKYVNITDNSVISETIKQYNPKYDHSVKNDINYVKNANTLQSNTADVLSDIIINYSQTKPSTEYKFDYYYEIIFNKI